VTRDNVAVFPSTHRRQYAHEAEEQNKGCLVKNVWLPSEGSRLTTGADRQGLRTLSICSCQAWAACRARPPKLDGSLTDNEGKVRDDEGNVDLPKDAGELRGSLFCYLQPHALWVWAGRCGRRDRASALRAVAAGVVPFVGCFGDLRVAQLAGAGECRRDVRLLLCEIYIRRS
jgi:hypothetical protein